MTKAVATRSKRAIAPVLDDYLALVKRFPLQPLSSRQEFEAAGAILDRFLHHAITIAISGRSYRVKASLPPPPENKQPRKSHERATAGGAS